MTDPANRLPPPSRSSWLSGALALATLVLLVHGVSLQGGLFMDDWAHIRQLREADWSLRDLAAACRLELVGGIAQMWFMPECTLRFFRPLAFGLMKLTYTLSGWDPAVMHAASLVWHLLVCLLLMRLLERLGARRLHAWLVAALFAVHPGHVVTVQWIAVQTELMVTAFLLIATLAFADFRGWPAGTAGSPRTAGPNWGAAVLAAVGYVLALGCRENAILFPIVMAAAEPLVGRTGRRRALALYGVLAVIAGIYLLVRWQTLGGVQLPPRPYVFPPADPGFLRFAFDKMCYYLIGEFLLVPCVPIGGLPYFTERPFIFYGLSAGTLALLAWNLLCWRTRSPGWLGVAWLVGFFGPLLPTFSSPHHLYLPGVGWALVVWLLLRELACPGTAHSVVRVGASRSRATHALAFVGLAGFTAVSFFLPVLAIDTGQRVEDTITSEVAACPRGLQDGDTLYVVNLPIIAHYLKLMVEERTGHRDLRVVPLTWAPRVLGLFGTNGVSELLWLDQRTFEIHIGNDRYFSAVFGRLVDEALGRDSPVSADRPVEFRDQQGRVEFVVELVEGDRDGISALRFTFREPPIRPGSHLFWGSSQRWAYEVPHGPATAAQ